MIAKELQKKIGEIFFIIENIRIYCQMDADEFEELLYTIFSE